MAIDPRALLISEINRFITDNSHAVEYLDVSIKKKLVHLPDLRVSDLELVLLRLKQLNSSLYQNIIIVIRLNSGLREVSRLTGLSTEKIILLLDGNEADRKSLSSKMIASGLCDQEFFEKTRAFYPDSLLSSNRAINFSSVLSRAIDSQALYHELYKELTPRSDVILSLLNAEQHPHSNWGCRTIEALLELKKGTLDNMPK
ncbi:hypothetical protein [Vibrio fluvialis]|uniref:hypothetical protein n=1 Tax=Vibrio fluvialis TaxID=676 RepID=UPI0023A915C1|nr:hypothetical protein [Vibrio fluvialis]MDE5179022.1 hypothetical protein [Vibrio fluvialis]